MNKNGKKAFSLPCNVAVKGGFTLIELLVVVGLLFILFALVAPTTANFYQNMVVEKETALLAGNLEKARDRAISAKEDSSWSVKFGEEEYTLFKGDDFDLRDDSFDETFSLPSGTKIEGAMQVTFEKITGKPILLEEEI